MNFSFDRRQIVLGAAAVPALMLLNGRTVLAQQTMSTNTALPMDAAGHKTATLQLGTFSKMTSQIAVQKAANQHVKQFAGFEVAEQTTIAQVLTDTQNPPPAPMTQMQQEMLRKLQSASGAAFDRDFIQGQIQTHEELLQVQQNFLSQSGTMSSDAVHVAMLARTVIQMHITMLNDLANMHA